MKEMNVQLMDHMGSDVSIVNAARVSFAKDASNFSDEQNARLIKFLAEHKHDIPFAHTAITLRMSAPISIRTQCFKHKIGFVENEVSRRYVRDTPEYFLPEFRFTPDKSIKQGSGNLIKEYLVKEIITFHDKEKLAFKSKTAVYGTTREQLDNKFNKWVQDNKDEHYVSSEFIMTQSDIQNNYAAAVENLIQAYEEMVSYGIAPEQARFILPQGTMTEWVWTGSLLAFARFYNLRKTEHAQKEIKELAEMVSNVIEPLYPLAWKALTQ